MNHSILKSGGNLLVYTIISGIATCILGVLFHFAYDFTGRPPLLAAFVPVNESVFEHLKLLFFPMLICLIIQYGILHLSAEYTDSTISNRRQWSYSYFFALSTSLLVGMAVITLLYYSLTTLMGSLGFINVIIYFVGVLGAYVFFYCSISRYRLSPFEIIKEDPFTQKKDRSDNPVLFWFPLLIIAVCILLFLIFTFHPPDLDLFIDPR